MATIVSNVGSFVTAAVGWVGSWVGAINAEGNEMLFVLAVAMPIAGFGIGALRRLININ